MKAVEVIDNFFPSNEFTAIQSLFLGNSIDWHWNDHRVRPGDGGYQLTSMFCSQEGYPTPNFNLIEPFLYKLKCKEVFRIKANLTFRTLFHRGGGYHIDFPNVITSILYINTNNGYTKFQKGGKVKSVANRMLVFDSNLKHQAVSCTDQMRRVVVNFNYRM
tara:strand:- start:242 stop:724 length:483 start_codon:yes stop_codon:yes gene_type:complete